MGAWDPEKLKKGVSAIKKLLVPVTEEEHKKQLKELAVLNGTYRPKDNIVCHHCGDSGHRLYQCPKRVVTWKPANVICANCNERSHITQDCPHPAGFLLQKPRLDSEYNNFMKEISGETDDDIQEDSTKNITFSAPTTASQGLVVGTMPKYCPPQQVSISPMQMGSINQPNFRPIKSNMINPASFCQPNMPGGFHSNPMGMPTFRPQMMSQMPGGYPSSSMPGGFPSRPCTRPSIPRTRPSIPLTHLQSSPSQPGVQSTRPQQTSQFGATGSQPPMLRNMGMVRPLGGGPPWASQSTWDSSRPRPLIGGSPTGRPSIGRPSLGGPLMGSGRPTMASSSIGRPVINQVLQGTTT